MNKTIFILGAGQFQVPAISKAKELGLRTLVCSYLKEDPGMKLAHKSYLVSTLDKEKILSLAINENIDGIMTIASEASMPTVTYVAERLNLPCHSSYTSYKTFNKFSLREVLLKKCIKTPRFLKAYSLNEALDFYKKLGKKAIIKPLESSGSRGVFEINSEGDIIKHFNTTCSFSFIEKGLIIEEYLYGSEIGGEALFENGSLVFIQCTNKYLNKYKVPIGHSVPCRQSIQIQESVKDLVQNCGKALKIDSGPLNFDIMITETGPVVIELGSRLGGNCLPTLMKHYTNVDTIEQTIRFSVGEPLHFKTKYSNQCFGVKIIGSHVSGQLQFIEDRELIMRKHPQIIDIVYDYKIGENVKLFNQGGHRIGHVLFQEDTIEKLDTFFNKIDSIIKLNVI